MMKKHIDISIAEVSEAYAGAVGILWELVMGAVSYTHLTLPTNREV